MMTTGCWLAPNLDRYVALDGNIDRTQGSLGAKESIFEIKIIALCRCKRPKDGDDFSSFGYSSRLCSRWPWVFK
jgi:hypothetical protein